MCICVIGKVEKRLTPPPPKKIIKTINFETIMVLKQTVQNVRQRCKSKKKIFCAVYSKTIDGLFYFIFFPRAINTNERLTAVCVASWSIVITLNCLRRGEDRHTPRAFYHNKSC